MTSHPRIPNPRLDRGSLLLQQAMLALDQERPQDAERIAADALKADPRNMRALHLFACALLMQGRAQEAAAKLDAVARSRHDPEIETLLAVALHQAGRTEDALRRLKLATKRQPPFPGAFYELGCLLCALDRDEEAIEIFRRGIAVAPMMPDLAVELGYALLRRRNCAEAKAAFARALEISPNSPDALSGMAKAHLGMADYQVAAAYFRRCLTIRPDDAAALINLGHCLLELGQHDAGYDCFRTAGRGSAIRYGNALSALVCSGRGRFWLKPSAAAQFMRSGKT
jgi:tetratricopeptide (TPR) repeat protein